MEIQLNTGSTSCQVHGVLQSPTGDFIAAVTQNRVATTGALTLLFNEPAAFCSVGQDGPYVLSVLITCQDGSSVTDTDIVTSAFRYSDFEGCYIMSSPTAAPTTSGAFSRRVCKKAITLASHVLPCELPSSDTNAYAFPYGCAVTSTNHSTHVDTHNRADKPAHSISKQLSKSWTNVESHRMYV